MTKFEQYRTRLNFCACPDRRYRHRDCKHNLTLRNALETVREWQESGGNVEEHLGQTFTQTD